MNKYEPNKVEPVTIKADDVSLYPYNLAQNKIWYSRNGRDEKKNVPVQFRLIHTGNEDSMRGRNPQVVIEIRDDTGGHSEDMGYNTKPHKTWVSQGKIFIDLETFEKDVLTFLERCRNYKEKK